MKYVESSLTMERCVIHGCNGTKYVGYLSNNNNNNNGKDGVQLYVCILCLVERNKELEKRVDELEKKLLERKRKEAFIFFIYFLLFTYKLLMLRSKKIQQRIIKGNNYNVKLRDEISVDFRNQQRRSSLGNTPSCESPLMKTDTTQTQVQVQEVYRPLPPPRLIPPSSAVNSDSQLLSHFHHIVFQNALDPILIHDLDGFVVDANDAACHLTGYPIDELVGMPIRLLETRYVEPDPVIMQQLMNGASFKIYGEHVSKQGRIFPVEVSISLVHVDGKPLVVGLFRDITMSLRAEELEKASEIAKASNQAKNIFLTTMSHEIRTPLYGVTASLEWIYQHVELTEEQLEVLDCAMDSACMLKSIMSDVLDLSVLEMGMFKLDHQPFSFLTELAHIVWLVAPAAECKALRFVWEHNMVEMPLTEKMSATSLRSSDGCSPVYVMGDRIRFRQVLMSLVGNALKFTPTGGKVHLNTQVLSQDEVSYKVQVVVKDTGIGINEDLQQKIFSTFTQGEKGASRSYGGTGLGLYIARQLVEMMGGKLSVQSKVGQGSIFTLVLRLRKSHSNCILPSERTDDDRTNVPAVVLMQMMAGSTGLPNISGSPKAEAHKRKNLRKLKKRERSPPRKAVETSLSVLLVEDNLVNQKVGLRLLGILGIKNVDVASDGLECLNILQQKMSQTSGLNAKPLYDLILMDKQMPKYDGIETTKAIRKMENEKGLVRMKIIALTADCRSGLDDELYKSGMDDILNKPVSTKGMQNMFLKHGLLKPVN